MSLRTFLLHRKKGPLVRAGAPPQPLAGPWGGNRAGCLISTQNPAAGGPSAERAGLQKGQAAVSPFLRPAWSRPWAAWRRERLEQEPGLIQARVEGCGGAWRWAQVPPLWAPWTAGRGSGAGRKWCTLSALADPPLGPHASLWPRLP